jgi:alpha-L-rhamnosidase
MRLCVTGWSRVLLLLIPATLLSQAADSFLTIANPRSEYKVNPIGIDVSSPRMSWELVSSDRGTMQSAYEVQVALSEKDLLEEKLWWDSGKTNRDTSIDIPYEGPPLKGGQRYYWRVQVWDNHGHNPCWSAPAFWEMGLFEPSDWKSHWITPALQEDPEKSNPSPMLRRVFEVHKNIHSARLYASAMGLYEFHLNGARVGDQYFTPGWTAYDFRYQYQTFDVTPRIKPGKNCLGAILGDGWFRGNIGFRHQRNAYGKKVALLAQLVITYKDGKQQIIGTDENWRASTGPILSSDIYNGETYDARLERSGWSTANYDDRDWNGVTVMDSPKAKLVAEAGPPVRATEEIKPVKIIHTPEGDTVLDLGQNMVGWMRVRLNAPAGTAITLRHAEVLDSQGNFYTANLRSAQQTDRYTTSGHGVETFEPHFTFHGFRYVAVDGWPGELPLDAFTGVVVHSAVEVSGSLETSNPMLNQLEHNIVWGQEGNFVDVPTDCPQRDERLGWTGDAQVFAPTAMFLHNSAAFYTKWLKDLALDQQDDGAIPFVIPNVLSHTTRQGESGAAGWGDAAVVVPWTLYLSFGDRRVLEEQYPSMKAWVEFIRKQAGPRHLWNTRETFGDWLAYATNQADYPGATTDKDLVQTAYFAHSTDLLRQTAEVLGKTDDTKAYGELLDQIRLAFQREFVTPNGRLASDTQTAYALALAFDLLPQSQRKPAAARLAADVRSFEHLTTGFLGTPLLCRVLSDYGYLDEAYMLLNRKEYPSWLYPITKGATTIWERWDGIKPDGSLQNPSMNSFNHYAYGAIGEWMYSVMAGINIDPHQPGYKHTFIEPRPGGGLEWVKCSLHTMYGDVSSSWEIKAKTMTTRILVPPNTTATIRLPDTRLEDVRASGIPLGQSPAVRNLRQEANSVSFEVGSGSYVLESDWDSGTSARVQ